MSKSKNNSVSHLSVPSNVSLRPGQDHVLSDDEWETKSQQELLTISKWNSQMFDVRATSIRDYDINMSDYFQDQIHGRTKYLIIPTFGCIALAAVVMAICSLIGEIASVITFFVILGLNILASLIGALGVYKWGTVEDCIDFFHGQNEFLEDQVELLSKTKETVKNEAKMVFFSVNKLKKHGTDLEKHLHEFDKLRQSLESISGDNENILEMVNEVNKQYEDMQRTIYENERAHLLCIYYTVASRDDIEGLSKKEYRKFLGRLNAKTRKEFEMQGGFEKMDVNNDGTASLEEFEDMLDDILAIVQEESMKDYVKTPKSMRERREKAKENEKNAP